MNHPSVDLQQLTVLINRKTERLAVGASGCTARTPSKEVGVDIGAARMTEILGVGMIWIHRKMTYYDY